MNRDDIMEFLSAKLSLLVEMHTRMTTQSPRLRVGEIVTWVHSAHAPPNAPLPPEPMIVVQVFVPVSVEGPTRLSAVMVHDVEVIGINADGILVNVFTDSRFLERYDVEAVADFIQEVEKEDDPDPGPTIN